MSVEHAQQERPLTTTVPRRSTDCSNPLTRGYVQCSIPFQQRVPLFQFPPPYRAGTLEQDQPSRSHQ